jgi:hypothetical protein
MHPSRETLPELVGKKVDILKELVPKLDRLAVLHGTPAMPGQGTFDRGFADVEEMAKGLSIQTSRFVVGKPADLESTFMEIKKSGAQAVLVFSNTFTLANARPLAELTLRHRLPDIHDVSPT